MPSTFTSNGGIELPANGEQDGIWGGTVNDNMQIIDRLTNGVGAIALSGTTHTLTTLDGDLSDGQYAVLVFGGAPSGTNTVTINPNDAQHVYIVRNTTAESIVLTQGSGGNVTVAAGKAAIVACDGAGSGAAVTDITAGFSFQAPSAALTAIAALAVTDGNFIVANGTTWVAESGDTVLNSIGVTATTAELNIMDGVTATTAELNILDGVTWPLIDYNTLTATAAELNQLSGITLGNAVTLDEVTTAQWRDNTADKLLSTDQVWGAMAEVTLTDGANIALDLSTGFDFVVTLAGNRTLNNPTNTKVGQRGRIRVVQDATGSRTLAFGNSYEFANGIASTLTTTAAAEDVLYYDVISSTRILVTIVRNIS